MKGLAGWGLTAGPHPTRWVMGLTGRRPSLGDEGADGCEGPSSVVTGGAGAVTWGQGGPAPLCSEEAQEVATEKEPQRVRRKRGARGVRREDDSERQPQAGVRRACGGVAESVRSSRHSFLPWGRGWGRERGGGAESLRLPCSAVGVSARTLPHAVCPHPRATWWLTSQSSGRWGGRVATPGRARAMATQGTGPARSPHLWEKECGDGSHVTWLW